MRAGTAGEEGRPGDGAHQVTSTKATLRPAFFAKPLLRAKVDGVFSGAGQDPPPCRRTGLSERHWRILPKGARRTRTPLCTQPSLAHFAGRVVRTPCCASVRP